MIRKVFWPNNLVNITFGLVVSIWIYLLIVNYMQPLVFFVFTPLVFVLLAFGLFFYFQRLVISEKHIIGPTAYGKRRSRVSIPREEVEVFFEKHRFQKYLIIRHKKSSKQIYLPRNFFQEETVLIIQGLLNYPSAT